MIESAARCPPVVPPRPGAEEEDAGANHDASPPGMPASLPSASAIFACDGSAALSLSSASRASLTYGAAESGSLANISAIESFRSRSPAIASASPPPAAGAEEEDDGAEDDAPP